MAIAYIGNRGSVASATAGLSNQASFSPSGEILAGHLLIVTVSSLVAGLQAVTDSVGNEWQIDAEASNGATVAVAICSSVLANDLHPSDSVIVAFDAVATTFDLNAEEFSGILSPAWLDKTASNSGIGTALNSGTTGATVLNDEVCVAAFGINAAEASWTKDAAYTGFGIVSQVGLGLLSEYRIVAATGAQVATGTAGTTGTWAGAIATYEQGATLDEVRGPDPMIRR